MIFRCVARILSALDDSAASAIQDSRLQVVARPHDAIWAYFPIYGRRRIVRQLPYPLGPDVRVLLVVGEEIVANQLIRATMSDLAHHFGHAFCYSHKPGWIHDCFDANRAARKCGLGRFLLDC